MGRTVLTPRTHRAPRELDRPQRDLHLRLAGRLRELLDRLPIEIAAREVHAAVGRRRVALQDLFDEAHPFDETRPVVGRAKTETGDGVARRDLRARFGLLLRPQGVLGRPAVPDQAFLERGPQAGNPRAVLAYPGQEFHDERGLEGGGKRRQPVRIQARLERRHVARGRGPGLAAFEHLVADSP